ncbi:MAG TPA: hypothetical protein VK503_04525 [Candidatus Bathyarchaeia archaeon]|nr:hypothetical protein [Candidatus Bathyarchaeia archaeon]
MRQIEIRKLSEWLRHTLSPKIIQAERERNKLLLEIERAIRALPDYCNQLSKKAEQDIETKHDNRAEYKAAKALAKLTTVVTEICKSVNIPQEKNTATLRGLQRDLSKAASEGARIRTEYLRQIRPYYILDMMTFGGNIDKLRRLSEELHTFLMTHGTILRSLEEFDEKMRTIEKLQTSRDTTSAQRKAMELQVSETRTVETNLRANVDRIRQNRKMREYIQIDENLRTKRKELILSGFSRLGRPLRKLASISERGDYPIAIEVREAVKEYLTKPFSTFLREADGYPKLKAVMTALQSAVSSGKLSLKQREAKKVLDRTEQVVSENSLAKIHHEARTLKDQYDQCLIDKETASLVKEMKDLRQKGRTNRIQQKDLMADLQRITAIEEKANEQISNMTKEIEEFCSKITGEAVKVE